jgi:hypothetical protein
MKFALALAALATVASASNRCQQGWGWYANNCYRCVTGSNGVQPHDLPDECRCPASFEYDYGKGCVLVDSETTKHETRYEKTSTKYETPTKTSTKYESTTDSTDSTTSKSTDTKHDYKGYYAPKLPKLNLQYGRHY